MPYGVTVLRSSRSLAPARRRRPPRPPAPEGIPHGIATAAHRPAIDASLDVLGVARETVLVQGNEVSRGKPEPDLFLLCAERLGVTPAGDCAVACDGPLDLVAARRAGMHAVGVLSGGQSEEELLQADASRVFRDPEHLLGELAGLGLPAGPLYPPNSEQGVGNR